MTDAELLELFRQAATEVTDRQLEEVTLDSQLAELGIDSLPMLEIVSAMEEKLGLTLPDEKLIGIDDLRKLLELIRAQLEPSG